MLIAPNQPINHVYFPENALASIIAISPEGQRIEAGLYGRDGMSGVAVVHDSDQTPLEHFIQIADGGFRLTAEQLRSAVARSPSLLTLFLRYGEALSIQTAQTALSNAAHTIDERLARWLLMCHDRVDGNELRLTHEFLSLMLGVRRAGVTTALHALEAGRMVTAVRSSITIRDRTRLELLAADGYGVARGRIPALGRSDADKALTRGCPAMLR